MRELVHLEPEASSGKVAVSEAAGDWNCEDVPNLCQDGCEMRCAGGVKVEDT